VASGERPIFVLDVIDRPTFAFEAESLAQAEDLVRAPWLAAALDRFHRQRGNVDGRHATAGPRDATEAEAAVYRDFADEFAERSGQFLVALLPGG
jgi:hypothetical protein